jgi:hypothetical protein
VSIAFPDLYSSPVVPLEIICVLRVHKCRSAMEFDKVKNSLKEPTQLLELDWIENRAPVLRGIILPVLSRTLLQPHVLETMQDMSEAEQIEQLEVFLCRTAEGQERAEWLDLIKTATALASKKRRLCLMAMEHPEMREPIDLHWPEQITEGQIFACKLRQKLERFPVAKKVLPLTKDQQRAELIDELVKFITDIGMPIVGDVLDAVHSGAILSRVAGGRRLSTLKQKLVTLRRLADWTKAVHGIPFPTKSFQLMDYIEERAAEPCGPSVPGSILSAVKFVELVGGVQEANRIGKYPILDNMVKEITLSLMEERPVAKKKANPQLAIFVAWWEHEVVTETNPVPLRILCFVKLVRIWGCLRCSDLGGIPSKSLHLDETGNLTGSINASKTTGRLKKVAMIHFHISADAWIVEPSWLRVGLNLLLKNTPAKPFMIPLLTRDRLEFSDQEPSYTDHAITSRYLLSEVMGVDFVDDDVNQGWVIAVARDDRCLRPGVQRFWTEHSDRCTLPTWAKTLGVSKEDRDRLGRWRPSESDEYVRASKTIVLRVQSMVAETIRKSPGVDRIGEHETLETLGRWLADQGLTQEEVKSQVDKLQFWGSYSGSIPVPPVADQVAGDGFKSDSEDEAVARVGDGQLVVSLEKGTRPQTLHCVGKCWRIPGIHYARYIILDKGELSNPNPRFMAPYDRICRDCYADGKYKPETTDDSSSSSSSDSE